MSAALRNAEDEAARAELRARLTGSNIHPETLLATDYLNHFNEVVMLLGLAADMPACAADILDWTPKSYEQHFAKSGLSDRVLAIEAYRLAPLRFRGPFDNAVARLDTEVLMAQRALRAAGGDPERIARIAPGAGAALQRLIDLASSLIHGGEEPLDQAAIDRVIGGMSQD